MTGRPPIGAAGEPLPRFVGQVVPLVPIVAVVVAGFGSVVELFDDLSKWSSVAGPRQTKQVSDALGDLRIKRNKHDQKRTAAWQAILAKKPSWAQATIVAEYNVDTSDPMTDYFANSTERVVAIGWRSGSREDFRQLHAAARSFPETAESKFEERRDNYSMGQGNYISDHGWDGSGTGWVVKSRTLGMNSLNYGPIPEDALPEYTTVPTATIENVPGDPAGVILRASSTGRAGYIEVVFPAKPDEAVRDELKAAGFRWAKMTRCWYGPEANLPARYQVVKQSA